MEVGEVMWWDIVVVEWMVVGEVCWWRGGLWCGEFAERIWMWI